MKAVVKIKQLALLGFVITVSTPAALSETLNNLPLPQTTFTQPKILTLTDAVLLALRNNPDIRNAELQRVVDKFALEVARNQFEPQYTLGLTANYTNGNTPTYSTSPTATITTPLGTQFSVSDQTGYGGGNGINSVGTITVTQPLLQGFGRKVTEANLFNAVQTEKNNKLALKESVMTVIANVVSDYYRLVQDYGNLQTNQLSLQNTQETLRQTQLKIKAGKMPRTNQIEQESSVAEQQLTLEETKNQIQQDYQQLLTVLGLDPNSQLEIDKSLQINITPLPPLPKAIQLALANNISYQQALNSFEVTKRELVVAKDAQKWQLNLTASVSRPLTSNDDGSIPVNNISPVNNMGFVGSGSSTSKSLGVNLSIPIDKVSLKQQLVEAKIAIDKAKVELAQQKRELVATVTSDYQNLISLQQQIKLSESSVGLAQQSLNIEQLKYNNGRATPLDITSARNTLTRQQLSLIQSKISYINSLQQFYQELGITLDKWHILLSY